ncbi:NMT1/THI5 like domain protein [Dinoroseobacter shibae DFL 12 = DSM 16493]|uniref:Thiamine pyrimidine synthase n=1 Tax=Dinoroseobacter shibae (strain DSM 16493 / NCIMB 14021 / DFL 12) TaxID=398580 RepID=A8LHW8_DINSH|nr:ABC transporter substrate-binding protein [Dinoroseobacter shibae]ABV92915.1 NMT1/THI5 like domain protein [Dinoroseobacter shibae DFL 12 = DSM 16493]URF47851.1 ABC transporter substrate-binding protein [Dinoroseobacter shibae]URF52160.1 ABC transporter substrate-binding protein [Dinoroseobacter shibae]
MPRSTSSPRLSRRAALQLGGAALAAPFMARPARAATTRLTFQLDWKINAQFAGLFMAEAEGLYADAGLEVEIRPWADGVNVASEVAEGRAHMACAEQNLILGAQAAGAPIKAAATMFQASPYGLMAPAGAGLSGLEALRGKTVGVHVDGLKVMALVKGVNGIEEIEVVEIPYADKFARAVSGEMFAVQCYVIDEPIGVTARYGAAPEVLKLSDHGLLSTAQTIMASDTLLTEQPEVVEAFLAATFEGWARVLADKPAAAEMVVGQFVPDGSVYKDVAYQTRCLELLEPYVTGGTDDIGVISRQKWEEAATRMAEYGIVEALPDLSTTLADTAFVA